MKQTERELNIKYVQLDEELRGYFLKYDYFDQFSCLVQPGSLALGAFVRDEEEKDRPAGFLVAEPDTEDGTLTIRWLYVDSEYRGLGIGSNLLYLLFAEAAGRKNTRVMVRLSDEFLIAASEWDPERFFMDCLFEEEDAVLDEFVYNVGELTGSVEFKKTIGRKSTIRMLSVLSEAEKEEVYKNTEARVRNLTDEEISFALPEDGVYKAALFVRQYGDVYYPMALIGENEEYKEKLVRAALAFLVDEEPANMLRVECASIAGEKIMEKLGLHGKKYLISYREASVADYLNLAKESKKRTV